MIMKFYKFNLSLILLGVFMLVGCSQEEWGNQIDSSSFNDSKPITTSNIEANSNNSTQWYFDIIESEDPFVAFNELSNNDKAIFWSIKYNLFEEHFDLTEEQMLYLHELSGFVYEAHLIQDYDVEAFNELNKNILAVFEPNQAMDLIYYLDLPSTENEAYACFWCNEIVEAEPCIINELPQGGHYLSRKVRIKRYRFGIYIGDHPQEEIPCTWEEWLAEE